MVILSGIVNVVISWNVKVIELVRAIKNPLYSFIFEPNCIRFSCSHNNLCLINIFYL